MLIYKLSQRSLKEERFMISKTDNLRLHLRKIHQKRGSFETDQTLLEQVEQWRHVLKSHCQQAFKKIRINKKRHIKPLKPEVAVLVDKRNSLIMDHKVTENKIEVEEIEKSYF
jgi:hypothetical protein